MVKIRVLVVDDSVVIRRLLTDILSQDPDIEVVGTAPNGRIALSKLTQVNPDLVTLDIEMPELDGLETLPELRKIAPRLPVIMFSTLTERGAGATLEALARGATDYSNQARQRGKCFRGSPERARATASPNQIFYFLPETTRLILSKAHRHLACDGTLLLGGAETTLGLCDAFERVNGSKIDDLSPDGPPRGRFLHVPLRSTALSESQLTNAAISEIVESIWGQMLGPLPRPESCVDLAPNHESLSICVHISGTWNATEAREPRGSDGERMRRRSGSARPARCVGSADPQHPCPIRGGRVDRDELPYSAGLTWPGDRAARTRVSPQTARSLGGLA
ncbi:MAG: response regulator [Pirellulaceae bacterium]